ncbi:MAG: glycosyltransferase family 2 protein, partial [Armatimonadota bacterium]
GAIERLVAVAGRDPSLGAVGPRLLNSDGTPQVSTGPFPQALFRFLPSRFEQAYERRVQDQVQASPDQLADVDWLAGAALLFRREVYQRVGGLDERYYMWYDDLDWAQKLRRAGYRSVYVGDAVIVHHGRQSGGRLENRRLAEQLFDSEYTYLRLHHGRLTVCLVFALRLVKALLRRCLPLGQPAREEAAWRLAYHRSHFRRFCLGRLP